MHICSKFSAYNMNTHTYTHTHTHTHAHTHTELYINYQRNGTDEKVSSEEKDFQGRFERTDRGRMTDRNRKLVTDSWGLVIRERALTTGPRSEEWHSEHSGVCRGAELPGRSVKVKRF